MIELHEINMVSGVNKHGQGFITVTAVGHDRTMLVGQMSPKDWREHGLACVACAEAAEQDAAVYQTILDILGDEDRASQLAAEIITRLRKMREE